MHIVFTGGGTAGHVTPAVAMIEALCAIEADTKITFIGSERGMEKKLIEELGYPYRAVDVEGFSSRSRLQRIRAARKAITSVFKARSLLKQLRPDAVVGTGGYVSWPALRAAQSLGIPTLAHESNAIPGKAVRRLEGRLSRVLLNMPDAVFRLKHPEKAIFVGNPIRTDFQISKAEARKRLGIPKDAFCLVSFGGSRGAAALNSAVLQVISQFSAQKNDVFHIHGYGLDHGKEFENNGDIPRQNNILLSAYLKDLPLYLRCADLAVTRAGAMTLSELAAAECPAILIPSPHVAEDHQRKNALFYVKKNAARMLREEEAQARLVPLIESLYQAPEERRRMQAAMHSAATPNAAKKAAEIILKTAKNRQK